MAKQRTTSRVFSAPSRANFMKLSDGESVVAGAHAGHSAATRSSSPFMERLPVQLPPLHIALLPRYRQIRPFSNGRSRKAAELGADEIIPLAAEAQREGN